jgi:hypothetical protein
MNERKKEKCERLIKLGKHFIKVLKTEGMYNQFLTKYCNVLKGSSIRVNNSNGALFESMMQDVVSLVRMDLHHKGKDIDNLNDDYEYYTNLLNMLLHKYVEQGMKVHPERCAKLGEKIFNAFCTDIFGEEKFKKDMDAFNAKHMQQGGSMDDLRKRYENLNRMGMHISWEDFLNLHTQISRSRGLSMGMPMPSDMYYINNGEQAPFMNNEDIHDNDDMYADDDWDDDDWDEDDIPF